MREINDNELMIESTRRFRNVRSLGYGFSNFFAHRALEDERRRIRRRMGNANE